MSDKTRAKMKPLTSFIVEDKKKAELFKTAHCRSCSLANLEEVIVSADSLCIKDSEGDVKFLVGYKFICPKNQHDGYYDTPKGSAIICKVGDDKVTSSCANCKHATPVTVVVESGKPKLGKASKWGRTVSPKCTVRRVIYKCINPNRMEHFDTGTYMSSYVRCEHHEELNMNGKNE